MRWQQRAACVHSSEAGLLHACDDGCVHLPRVHSVTEPLTCTPACARLLHLRPLCWRLLQRQGEELMEPNAFGSLLQQAGAVGLNAATSHDATRCAGSAAALLAP